MITAVALNESLPIISSIISDEKVNAINARDLYKHLQSKQEFATWIKNRIEKYGFLENQDFITFSQNGEKGRPSVEYFISLDMAKELAMVERNEKGREARKYFIECEKKQARALKKLSLISYQHPENLIFSIAGEVYTTSQVLAKVSGKKHYHVLRDIREEIAELQANPKLDAPVKNQLLKGFRETVYEDTQGKMRMVYQLSEEAFLQMSLKYSVEIRARFIAAFTSYRNTLVDLYKARVLEKVIPQISTSRSFVYIIKEEGKGRLKIGISNNPEKRLKTLQTGSAEDLTLVYTSLVCSNAMEIEKNVHEHFQPYSIRGEWFEESLSVNDIVKYLEAQTYVLESDFDLSFSSKIVQLLENNNSDSPSNDTLSI